MSTTSALVREDAKGYTKFRIGPDDLVTIQGYEFRYAKPYGVDEGVVLRGVGKKTQDLVKAYSWKEISALYARKYLEIEANHFAVDQAIVRARDRQNFEIAPEITLRAVMASHFLAQEAGEDLGERFHRSDKDIEKFTAIFAEENKALIEEARRSLLLKGKEKVFVTPRQFRRILERFEASELDPYSLASRHQGRARVGTTFTYEEIDFQLTYVKAYRDLDRPTIKACWEDMGDANRQRVLDGKAPHRLPSLTTFQRLVIEGNDFWNEAGRFDNIERIQRKYELKGKGLHVTRPLQIVEMDDKEIDLVVMFTKNDIWDRLHSEVQQKIEAIGRVHLCVALDAFSRSILGMKIITGSPDANSALATLAMVAQNKNHIAKYLGAKSPWPQSGTPEAIHTDAGAPYVSSIFETAVLDFTGKHRIPPSKHPHLRGRVERFFRTINQRYTHLFSAQTFSNPLMKDEYKPAKYIHVTDGEFADLLARLIIDCYHNTKHRSLGMTPLQAWYRGSQFADGSIKPPPSEQRYREIFGLTIRCSLGNEGIMILGNVYSNQKLREVRKKWFGANLMVRMNEQDLSKISVKHKSQPYWIEVPAVFDGLKGVSLVQWQSVIALIEKRFGKGVEHAQETVRGAIKEVREVIALSKKRPGILVHQTFDERLKKIERGMAATFAYSQRENYDLGEEPEYGRVNLEDDLPADDLEETRAAPKKKAELLRNPLSLELLSRMGADKHTYDRSGFVSDTERTRTPASSEQPIRKKKKSVPTSRAFDPPETEPPQSAAGLPSERDEKPRERPRIRIIETPEKGPKK